MSDLARSIENLAHRWSTEDDDYNLLIRAMNALDQHADEIERLRGLLQRHHELRGKPASEEWVDGGPTYRLAMQLWRDTAAALAGAANQPIASRPEIILTGAQILDLHEMCGGEFDDTEWRVYRMEAFIAKADTDGEPDEPMPAGVYAILHEYPEEGFIGPLGVTPSPTAGGSGRRPGAQHENLHNLRSRKAR